MKGSALLDTMTREVAAECDRREAQAREEAEAIVAQARGKAEAEREAALAAAASEREVLDARARQKAQAEAVKAALAVQNEAVEAVLAKVRDEIRAIVHGPGFPAILDALIAEVMDVATGDLVVLAPPAHADHVRQWLQNNGHGAVTVEGSQALWDGVAVQDPQKTYRISNTLTGRFRRVDGEARRICMTTLFRDAAQPGGEA